MQEKKFIDLAGLHTALSVGIRNAVPQAVWVKAEISSLNVGRGGHCYIELSQSRDSRVIAQMRAIIWASTFRQISPCFAEATGVPLGPGQSVLLLVRVEYSALYGLSLIVDDIDPDFTLGDAQRKRQETLDRLRREGLMDIQKELALPLLPYSLAVISAPSAAGYRDFLRHLHENEYGFRFHTELFGTPMQGEDCAEGVADAIAAIADSGRSFDAILILRGGGGKLDLACFDEYDMCAAIARSPIPVLTAVGHDQDVHLCDEVSFDSVKTPTALADYFLGMYADEDARLWSLRNRLDAARRTRLAVMEGRLDVLKARLEAANPLKVLERGFVMAVGASGKKISSASECSEGGEITVYFKDGTARAKVMAVRNTEG